MLDCLGFGDWIEGIRGDWAASRDEEDEENKEKGEIGFSCDFFSVSFSFRLLETGCRIRGGMLVPGVFFDGFGRT
jgi:hypothetical protein